MLGRKLTLMIVLVAACTDHATHVAPPDLPESTRLFVNAFSTTSVVATLNGAWVVGAPASIKNGVIHTESVLFVGSDHSFGPLIALDINDGVAKTWDGHREGTATIHAAGNELGLTRDIDDPSIRWCHEISQKDGQVVIDGGSDPRMHRYPDFASARAAVDEEVLAQDPVRLMARYGGRVGDTTTVAGLIATNIARPRTIRGRRATVRGVIVEVWNSGIAIAPPGVVTPTVHCPLADPRKRFQLFQTVTATGIVRESRTLQLTLRGVDYRGDASGVFLDECQAR